MARSGSTLILPSLLLLGLSQALNFGGLLRIEILGNTRMFWTLHSSDLGSIVHTGTYVVGGNIWYGDEVSA